MEKAAKTDMVFMKLEDRCAKRYSLQIKVRYLKKGNSGWAECEVVDISRKGVGVKFSLRERIFENSEIYLEIYLPKQLDPMLIQGKVQWISKAEDGFLSGIELTRPLTNEVLDSIIVKYLAVPIVAK